MKENFRKGTVGRAILAFAVTVFIGATGFAFAAYNQAHENIMLRKPDGTPIKAADTVNNAFSMKTTCGACHGDKTNYPQLLSYDEIERHSYHAQLGANEIRGFNPFNPDSSDAFRKGAGPVGKNWVQSPGHVGSW